MLIIAAAENVKKEEREGVHTDTHAHTLKPAETIMSTVWESLAHSERPSHKKNEKERVRESPRFRFSSSCVLSFLPSLRDRALV